MTLALIPSDDIRLRQRCERVHKVRKWHRQFIDDLASVMSAHNGIGIAAPQVGSLLRICIVSVPGHIARAMVDPQILFGSDKMVTWKEGCLSFPGKAFPVKRHERVTVQYLDLGNTARLAHLDGLAAICAQHEIDHLDGVLSHMRATDVAAA